MRHIYLEKRLERLSVVAAQYRSLTATTRTRLRRRASDPGVCRCRRRRTLVTLPDPGDAATAVEALEARAAVRVPQPQHTVVLPNPFNKQTPTVHLRWRHPP